MTSKAAAATASAGPAVRRTDALPGVPVPAGAGALGVAGVLPAGVGGVEGEEPEPEPTVTVSFMPAPQWPVMPQM